MQLPAFAQDNQTIRLFLDVPADTFTIRPDSAVTAVRLPDQFIIPRSERIFRNAFKLFRGIHYRLDDRTGMVFLVQPLQAGDSLTVIYQKYPLPLISEYYHQKLEKITETDSTNGRVKSIAGSVQNSLFDELDSFSSNLQRSGSIVRGVQIGSNRDLTLNSGLNLELSGFITPDVQLVAALTDESTPIQPEGNTQTLREVDKVFVKIISPHLGGTLGDFNLAYQNTLYGNLKRKLQGITAYGQFKKNQQQVTYATSRGTFHTNQFLGQEGNQGPYQLVGKNGEREIIVLAGTERVYVNGQPQVRGENNDYTIDYSLGQLTFTNRRLITSEDRIEVDFEYADNYQRYGKSLIGVSAQKSAPGGGFGYDVRLFREWDDTRNLLEDSSPLTDEEKAALSEAGDDPFQASVSGASYVGPGNGNYVKRDTVIAGDADQYFLYAGTQKGDYTVRFTGVGRGNGSYVKERLGVYRYVGSGAGDYLPVRLVPLAGDKRLADVNLSYQAGGHFSIGGEASVSQFDKNIFSGQDDNDNTGQAFALGAGYRNAAAELFGKSIGSVDWRLDWKRRQARFSPLDRLYQPGFDYKWNLNQAALQGDENTLESSLLYRPFSLLQMDLNAGLINQGNGISSRRGRAEVTSLDSTVFRGNAYLEQVNSEDAIQRSDWRRMGADFGKRFWKFYPYARFRQENRQVRNPDSSLTGFYFTEPSLGLQLLSVFGTNVNFTRTVREDYLYDPREYGERLKLSTSSTSQLDMDVIQSQNWQGRLSFVYRDKNFTPFFEQLPADSMALFKPDAQFQDTTWQDRQSHLANLEIQYRNDSRTIDSRWDYQMASELSALQEKVFLNVGENRGNYRFDETLREYVPDPQGDYLLVIVPTGRFESVTNITAGWQIRYRPKLSNKTYNGLSNVLHNISTFTYLKVDEKSREQNIWQLYILNLSKFHNSATTLEGSYTVNQDIYFFERNPDFGITLRNRYRDNLQNQYVDAGFNETRRLWDRSVSWRQKLYRRKLSQELEYTNSLNYRSVSAIPSRDRNVIGNSLNWTLNYRPVYAWQFRLDLEGAYQKDRAEANQLSVRYFEIKPQVDYSMRGKARGFANLSYLRVDVTDNPFGRPIPFEMGRGKKEGNSFLWNFRFEYFVSSNITASVNYTGRLDSGADRIMHLGQAEVRAFF